MIQARFNPRDLWRIRKSEMGKQIEPSFFSHFFDLSLLNDQAKMTKNRKLIKSCVK